MSVLLTILSALLGALPKLLEVFQGLWDKFGEKLALRWDAARDQRLRDEKATLEAITEAQRKAMEAKSKLDEERAKTPERLSKGWWDKGAGIILLTVLLSGCAMLARPPLPVAPSRVLLTRPTFIGLSEIQQAWLNMLVTAQEENCTELAVIGGKSPTDAAKMCIIR
mgnify:CR=1 FL=1